MGAGVALLTHENHSTVAAETLNLIQDSPAATSSASALQGNTITMPTASREDDDDEVGDNDDDDDEDDKKKSGNKKSKHSDDDDDDEDDD